MKQKQLRRECWSSTYSCLSLNLSITLSASLSFSFSIHLSVCLSKGRMVSSVESPERYGAVVSSDVAAPRELLHCFFAFWNVGMVASHAFIDSVCIAILLRGKRLVPLDSTSFTILLARRQQLTPTLTPLRSKFGCCCTCFVYLPC